MCQQKTKRDNILQSVAAKTMGPVAWVMPILIAVTACSSFNSGTMVGSRFLPRDATQSAVMPLYVVYPSVCLSIRDVQVPWYRWEYFENNLAAYKLMINARAYSNIGDLVQREHPQNWGGMRVGLWAQKPAISLKRSKIGPMLLWRTNRKSHTRFQLAPKSMTLDDLERPKRTLAEKIVLRSPP